MTSAVIAYEDAYCDELHRLIKALRRDRGLPGMILESTTVRGTGGFASEVSRLLRTPLKQTKRPPDRLVCLADADRPRNLLPSAVKAPDGDRQSTDTWVRDFEERWRAHLLREARVEDRDAARLRVVCVRWSKESLLVAAPSALVDFAGADRRAAIEEVFRACDPDPRTAEDADFVSRYRRADLCMGSVVLAAKDRGYKKGLHDEDILRDHVLPSEARRADVHRRCPDLERVLSALD